MASNPLQVIQAPTQAPLQVQNAPQNVPSAPLPVYNRPAAPMPQLPVYSQPANASGSGLPASVPLPTAPPPVVSQPANVPQISGVTTADGQPVQQPSNLTPEAKQKIATVVQKMIDGGESDTTIQAVVDHLKVQYSQQQATPTSDNPQDPGFLKTELAPELTGLVSGARSVQATPSVVQALYQFGKQLVEDPASIRAAIMHPSQPLLNTPAVAQADQTMKKSIGGVKPLAALNNEEALGLATQAAGQGLMIGGGGTFSAFGLQGMGKAMQQDKGAYDVVKQGLTEGLLAKGTEKLLPYGGKVLGSAYDKFIPQAAKNVVEPLLSKASNAVGNGLKSLGTVVNPILDKAVPDAVSSKTNTQRVTDKLVQPAIKSLEETYNELFSGTKSGTKGLAKSLEQDKNPSSFLAKNGYVVDVAGGKVNATPVISQIQQDVEPLDQALTDILKAKDRVLPDAERISLDDIGAQAKARVTTSQAKGGGTLQDQHKAVDNIIGNLKQTYADTVNLSDLNEIKRGQWQQSSSFDMTRPGFMGDVNYAIGKSAKQTIEAKVPEASVQKLNSFVGDHYDAIRNLQRIDGNAVKGGRLGKYFNRVVGSVIGSHFGPLGGLAGGLGADYVSELMSNNAVATPLKRMILSSIPEDNAMYKAAQEALTKLKYGQPLLNAPSPGLPQGQVFAPIPMGGGPQDTIAPGVKETANMVKSRHFAPKYTPSGGPVTQIFGEPK